MASSDLMFAGSMEPAAVSTRSFTRARSSRVSTSWPRATTSGPRGRSALATSVCAKALEIRGRRRRKDRRRAADSGSRTTSFTMAEESRYVARSVLIAPQACEHARGRFLARSKIDRLGEILQLGVAGRQVTRSSKTLERTSLGKRCEDGDRAAAVGDFEGFSSFDPTEQLAGLLPQLAHAHLSHVLFVAHRRASRKYPSPLVERQSRFINRLAQGARRGAAFESRYLWGPALLVRSR